MNPANPPAATTTNARDRLIDTAIHLFNRYGFHATGVDRIVAVAKVAKKTLYAHFPSKEDLIIAALSRKRAAFADKFLPAVLASSDQPRDRLLSLFELAKSWFNDPDFYGCIFVNAAVEYSEPGHPINACAREFKTLLRGFALEQAQAGGAADPEIARRPDRAVVRRRDHGGAGLRPARRRDHREDDRRAADRSGVPQVACYS